ncbi:MAG: hypothetical protein ACOX0A_09455 [Thermoguttaceae bacterium]
MNRRIFHCVFLGVALGLLALDNPANASVSICPALKLDALENNAAETRAELFSSLTQPTEFDETTLIPVQFGRRSENMPGIVRPLWNPAAANRYSQQAAQHQSGAPRVRIRPNPAPNPPNPQLEGPPADAQDETNGNDAELELQEDQSPTMPEFVPEESDPIEVPTEGLPEQEEAPDTSDVPVPGTGAPEDEAPLDLGNDNEDAPDSAVKIPEAASADVDLEEEPVEETPEPAAPPVTKSWRYHGAEKAVEEMTNDLLDNLRKAGGANLYERWRSYNASISRRTNSLQTGNELNSRCRLSWYERLYADPLRRVGEAEKASHLMAQCFMGSSEDVVAGVRYARFLTDVPVRQNRIAHKGASSPEEAIEMLKAALVEAASHHAKAIAPLSRNELAAVMNEAHTIFCEQVQSGHTVEKRGRAMYLIDVMEKINKSEMYDAGEAVLSILHPQTLDQLRKIDFDSLQKVRINDNQEVGIVTCEAGDILIGDRNRTIWELDRYPNTCCVIDLGGDDVYHEGSCILNRPLLVTIDLGQGNDEYSGKNVAIQGGSILGVSVWYDDGGNDRYTAKDVCQGSTIGGFGVLINEDGDDHYLGFLREQGASICGFGVLIDRGGNDDYRGALFAQGLGGPGGFGALVDRDGDDHYYVGGYYFDSYPEHPGYDGWGQGVGAGIRRVACGGVGMLLDGGGDDAYEFDYFGHGGGYWMGIGIARDFAGNDVRYGATSTMYDGSPRRERRWQRFGCGFGCHYAVGYLFDDHGDDVYGGTIMGSGMGWDLGAGFLVEFDGDDTFEANGGLTQGCGAEGSIGAIMNYRGNDAYNSSYVGYSNNQLSYHSPSNCGSNFSFVIDHGGRDVYGADDSYRRTIKNNMVTRRGNITGMIVDRPAPDEVHDDDSAQSGERPVVAQAGYAVKPTSIKTMAPPPPLHDTTPHATSSGQNAFNPSANDGWPESGGFRGFGLFGGGRFL